MIGLRLFQQRSTNPRIIFLGAHCDDIEIGCGATVLTLLENYPNAEVHWIVFGSNARRAAEAESSATAFLGDRAKTAVRIFDHRTSFFPTEWADIKSRFEELKALGEPDVIFTHNRADMHQDHRVIGELARNTWRDNLILEYEIPKYDGDLGQPSVYVPVTREMLEKKVGILMEEFPSQHEKQWYTRSTFEALPRLRGIESNAPDGFAEAFYCTKMCLTP